MKSPGMNRFQFFQVLTLFYGQAFWGRMGFTSEIPIGKLPFYSQVPTLSLKPPFYALKVSMGMMRNV